MNTQTLSKPLPQAKDNFFASIGNTKPYFKAAFEGFAGSGKTYTTAQIAIGLHDGAEEEKPIDSTEEAEVEEINKAIEVATDIVAWSKTPAGKDTIDRLQGESRKAMNELFAMLHQNPDMGRLISAVARFEASIQMLRRFIGAAEDLDTLTNELIRRKEAK